MGAPAPRYDARLKVTGEARYPADIAGRQSGLCGPGDERDRQGQDRLRSISTDARAVPGVLDILTYENTAELKQVKFGDGSLDLDPGVSGPNILHAGQIIAVVRGRHVRGRERSRATRQSELQRADAVRDFRRGRA